MWEQIKRVLKPRGACVLFGSQPFTSALVMSNPGWFRHHWIYEKTKATNYVKARVMPMRYHEDVCVFGPEGVKYNPQMEDGPAYRKVHRKGNGDGSYLKDTRVSGDLIIGSGRFPSSIIRFQNPSGVGQLHPTQKPLALLEYLVRTYTDPGDLVLDFTMGSGTTGHACMNLGRSFVGIEKDAAYFAIAEQRIADAADPLRHMEAA
jgi:hypothetical protein